MYIYTFKFISIFLLYIPKKNYPNALLPFFKTPKMWRGRAGLVLFLEPSGLDIKIFKFFFFKKYTYYLLTKEELDRYV